MIKKIVIRKAVVFFTALTFTIIVFSCGAKDDKNQAEPYPTTDTTQHMEHKNDNRMQDSAATR